MSLHGGLYKGQGRRLLASAAVVVLGLVIGAAPSIACSPADKVVWVCKVVGPPNHYRLETGNNPIRVAEGSAEYLAAFADSQPSFVVAHDSFALCEDGFPSEGQGASVVAPTITTAPSCNAPGGLPHSPQMLTHGMSPPMALHTPVSYTHLRAHETVLDLVCRLLLEKKKNK